MALAFACISAFQNVSLAEEVEKSKSASLGLEAQAHALNVGVKNKPTSQTNATQANVATEVKKPLPTPKVSTTSKVVTTAKASDTSSNKTKSSATSKTSVSTQTTNFVQYPTPIDSSKTAKTQSNKGSKSVVSETTSSKTSSAKNSADKNVSEAETKTATKTKRKPHKSAVTLVPPPPPTMPTYLNTGSPIAGSFDLGLSVNYMSLDDLKFQRKTLEKKLEAALLDDKDQKRFTSEKQERAKRFVELYEEGVVSRRELETAQEDSERALRDIEQTHIKVSEIQRVLGQVKERIVSMEAAKQPFKVSSKKSKPDKPR